LHFSISVCCENCVQKPGCLGSNFAAPVCLLVPGWASPGRPNPAAELGWLLGTAALQYSSAR
jgi:hypothetical protein